MAHDTTTQAAPATEVDARWEKNEGWPQLVLRFNEQPARYADTSWLPAVLPRQDTNSSDAYINALSFGLLSELGLLETTDWRLQAPASRLFLLDAACLHRLALVVGIASHRDTLRQVIQREHLKVLHNLLGELQEVLWLPMAELVPRAQKTDKPLNTLFSRPAALQDHLAHGGMRQLLRLLDLRNPDQCASAARARLMVRKDQIPHLLPSLPPPEALALCKALTEQAISRWMPQWNWLF